MKLSSLATVLFALVTLAGLGAASSEEGLFLGSWDVTGAMSRVQKLNGQEQPIQSQQYQDTWEFAPNGSFFSDQLQGTWTAISDNKCSVDCAYALQKKASALYPSDVIIKVPYFGFPKVKAPGDGFLQAKFKGKIKLKKAGQKLIETYSGVMSGIAH